MKVFAKTTGLFTIVLPNFEFVDSFGYNEVEDSSALRAEIHRGRVVLKEEEKETPKPIAQVEEKQTSVQAPKRKKKQ